jgi:hypothetical protein
MEVKENLPSTSWRTHFWIILILLLLSPINLGPIFFQMGTHIPGDVMDSAEYPLNEWWTAHALLDLKQNPFLSNHMFFPLGNNMVHHTYTFLDGLVYTLLRSFIPLIPFHNLMIWMAFFINAAAAYLLYFICLRIPWLAFMGAVAFGHCPPLISYYKTASLLEVYNLVSFVFFSILFVQKRRLYWGVPAGLVWGLTLYNYPYYFVFGGIWLAVLVGYSLLPWEIRIASSPGWRISPWAHVLVYGTLLGFFIFPILCPRPLWTWLTKRGLINWGTLAVGISSVFFVWSALKLNSLKNAMNTSCRGCIEWRAFFSAFLKSFPIHWLPPTGRDLRLWAGFVGLSFGLAALVGFPFFWYYFSAQATRVAVSSNPLEFSIFCQDLASFFAPFNPWLQGLYNRIALNWVSNRPIVGTPAFIGFGFLCILFWGIRTFFRKVELRLWIIAIGVFSLFALGPYLKWHGMIIESLPLPGYWIRYLPVIESARTLSRYLVPVFLFICLLIGLILKPVYLRLSSKGRVFFLSGLLLLVGFEYGMLPYPLPLRFSDYRVPEVYNLLAQETNRREGLLLDLPLLVHSGSRSAGKGETRKLYYQTVHHQKMIGGVSSKLDESVFDYFQNQPAIPKFWSFQPVEKQELAALIYAYEIDWIILEKRYYVTEVLRAYRSVFGQAPFLKIFFEDARFIGVMVDPKSPELEREALQYWRNPTFLSALIYPGRLKGNSSASLEMFIPAKLWHQMKIAFAPETVRDFYGLRFVLPEHPIKDIPFTSLPFRQEDIGMVIRPEDIFPLTAPDPAVVRLKISPGNQKYRPGQAIKILQVSLDKTRSLP